ncbi:DUF6624 domain-containing protein [Brevundimonas sp. CEF1]|uniref:DUF6624 domain-containing protein n=1 Tax=Brevundimonas sp. CEF1 TaxID=3442642 RepID=UPI003F50D88D
MWLAAIMLGLQVQGLSPEAQAIIAPVATAIEDVRAQHAALGPAPDEQTRLKRMGELDQAGRRVIMQLDFSRLSDAERMAAVRAASAPIEAVDQENQQALIAMTPPEGWFLKSRYGAEAAAAAFHIVQHSDEALWRRFLPVLQPLVATDEIDGQSYAMMFDRLATSEGRPQRYGTQFRCDNGKWRPYPIENVEALEAHRQEMAFPVPFAAYRAHFESQPHCPQTLSPPPPGMDIGD